MISQCSTAVCERTKAMASSMFWALLSQTMTLTKGRSRGQGSAATTMGRPRRSATVSLPTLGPATNQRARSPKVATSP